MQYLTHVSLPLSPLPLFLRRAQANSESAAFKNRAEVQSLSARYAAERESYAALRSALSLTSEELLAYVWIDAARERASGSGSSGPQSVVALGAPALLQQ